MSEILVHTNELRTPRELVRDLNSTISLLARGDVEKIVVAKGSEFVAVVLSVEAYARLAKNAEGHQNGGPQTEREAGQAGGKTTTP